MHAWLHHREHLIHLTKIEWHHIWHGLILAGSSSLAIGPWLALVHHHLLLKELLLKHGDLLLLEHHDLLIDNLLLLGSHLGHLRVLSKIHWLWLSQHHSRSLTYSLHTHKGSHLRNLRLGISGSLLSCSIGCCLRVLGRLSHFSFDIFFLLIIKCICINFGVESRILRLKDLIHHRINIV